MRTFTTRHILKPSAESAETLILEETARSEHRFWEVPDVRAGDTQQRNLSTIAVPSAIQGLHFRLFSNKHATTHKFSRHNAEVHRGKVEWNVDAKALFDFVQIF